jgi:NADPH:quinone reductase-like Zn-dependent oxidoreductase
MGKSAPGHGSYAERAVLLVEDTTRKPPQASFVQAAALPVAGGNAWDGLERLGVAEGDTLLINGVGGVSAATGDGHVALVRAIGGSLPGWVVRRRRCGVGCVASS